MKCSLFKLATVVLWLTLVQLPGSSYAQGSLTPPGAPAPTMKTADQIYAKLESRIPIGTNTTPGDGAYTFIITNSGSYFLASNLGGDIARYSGLIRIAANDVTLDLNGFALTGSGGSLNNYGNHIAIEIDAQTNIVVKNGTISGWQNYNGSYGYGVVNSYGSQNILCERLTVSDCGVGIFIGGVLSVVRDCICNFNGNWGIQVSSGIVSGCSVNNSGIGIIANAPQSKISNCYVGNNISGGILIRAGNAASSAKCVCIGNTCDANNINVTSSNCRIEDNHVVMYSGGQGIVLSASATNNIIIKNSVSGGGVNNYVVPDGNVFGPIANDSTGAITNSSPWANFSIKF